MLENIEFAENLLSAFCLKNDLEYRLMAIDVLIWITSIRMCRFRSVENDQSVQQLNYVRSIESKLPEIIKYGLIEGNRKLAHKVIKLLIACSM